ncbi:MAG: hypothetical protein NVSMB65_15600 [Chloroflexota bacterium]
MLALWATAFWRGIMSVEESKAVIQQFGDAMMRRDLAFIEAHPALAAHRAFYVELFAAFPDMQGEAQTTVAEGEWVASRVMVSGTHHGTFMGMPATGKHASWEVINMHRIVNGKIVETHGQADVMSMMQQLGRGPGAGGPPQR